jgi:ligand-binding sensor domain-containing protein
MTTEIINDVAIDSLRERIWLATDRGLGYIDMKDARFKLETVSKKSASAVYIDQSKKLWTAFQDIIQYGEPGSYSSFFIPPTVKIGTIQQMEVLQNGNIWFATTQGLYFYQPK